MDEISAKIAEMEALQAALAGHDLTLADLDARVQQLKAGRNLTEPDYLTMLSLSVQQVHSWLRDLLEQAEAEIAADGRPSDDDPVLRPRRGDLEGSLRYLGIVAGSLADLAAHDRAKSQPTTLS